MAANPSIQLGTDGNWAIKEDNLLAYKKDGTRFFNKEFDFTRGSLATFVDKDGLIKVSGVTNTELVTNGNFDNNSDWSNFGTPTTSEQSTDKAYLGSYSWYVVATAFRQGIFSPNNFSLVNGKTYKASLWIYAVDGNEILSGVTNSDATVFTSRTVAQGQWTNIVYYFTATATSASYISILSSSSTLEFYVDNVSVKEIQTDVPRIDFTDDATGHLLLEPQSTNLVQYSEDFSNGNWNTSNTRSVNFVPTDTIDPQGQTKAYKVTSTASNNQVAYLTSIVSGQTYTNSIYVKRISGSGNIILRDVNNVENHFQLSINDGWKRIQSTATSNSTNGRLYINLNTIGDVIEIWGAQQENLSHATSYIPTSGSTVTRNAEVCNNSGSAQDFNSSEGVLYAEIKPLSDNVLSNQRSIQLEGLNGSSDNEIIIQYLNDTLRFLLYGNSVLQFQRQETVSLSSYTKVALLYKNDAFKIYINGTERYTVSGSYTMPIGLNKINFNRSGVSNFEGKVKNVQVFKRAMSDGELYLLTVTQYQSYQAMATALNYTL